jgi:hypothetical protein
LVGSMLPAPTIKSNVPALEGGLFIEPTLHSLVEAKARKGKGGDT